MEMTRKRLEDYRSEKAEIAELKHKLAHLGEGDSLIGNDTIFDYRSGYPKPQAVVGYDFEREARLRDTYQKRIAKLEHQCAEVEKWVEEIPDSLTRRIFRMYFIEGQTQQCIGKTLNMDRSNVSKKIDLFFKVSHNSHYSHV